MTLDDIVYPDIEQRGRVYYLRKRVPSRYAAIESRMEVNLSLKTHDPYHAVECRNAIWAKLLHDWEAALAGHDAPASRAAYNGALAVLGDLRAARLRIGRDVSVVSFDDVGPLGFFDPPVTAVRHRLPDLASAALNLVLGGLADVEPIELRVAVDLVERASVAPPLQWGNGE